MGNSELQWETMSYQVLKPKHNLNDRNILPLVLEIKTTRSDDITDSAATSRLKRDHSLMDYSEEEISREFKKLTGQDVETVLSLAGKDTSPTSPTHIRYALHLAIILANSIGAPKGAVLQTSQQGGKEGGISKNAVTDVGTGEEVSTHVQDSAMEARLKKMEQQLSGSTQSQRKDKVEEALRNRSQDIPQTVKRARFEPSIPEWEIGLKFDPSKIAARDLPCRWVNYRGKALQPPFQNARTEEVASGAQFSLADLPFRDPDYFLAGNVCKSEYLQFWERINACEEVLDWIKYGVDVSRHFVHFKGDFRGVSYDSDTLPPILLSNSKTCIGYEEFILQSLLERVANRSMVVWGKVGEVEPPYLVMPLTVEPSKPRLCHDERFLNLWIKDNSFTLDTLKEVPRVIPKGSYMSNIDDKSGYDHISLSVNSRKYFGVQFGGWDLVYTSLPFGFKASAYIYQMTGMSVTSYCRQLGVPCLQYIDDRLIGEATAQGGMSKDQCGNPQRATAALYIVCEVLVRVGYFIGLRKSVFQPSQILQFLGMLVDSVFSYSPHQD
ncbi:uncharacterized protein [Argopecten irradians]|uniref:uncharacterized protein isoform X6 n=1 Tax=Argopecten irradians TaxID=31199 RepID=UPI00371A09E8